jgi:hypothetical protein
VLHVPREDGRKKWQAEVAVVMANKSGEIPADNIAYTLSITTVVISSVRFMTLYGVNVLDAAARRSVNDCAINEFNLGRLVIIGRNFITFSLVREQITK